MDYNARFFVRNSSISSHLLVPQYGNRTCVTCFDWFWYMVIPVLLLLQECVPALCTKLLTSKVLVSF